MFIHSKRNEFDMRVFTQVNHMTASFECRASDYAVQKKKVKKKM